MTTPKLYTANLSSGEKDVLLAEYTNQSGGTLYKRIRDNAFIDRCFVHDLTEVTVVPKDAVVIEGVTEPQLLRLFNLAVLHVPLDKFEDDWKLLGALAKTLNDKLIAERDAQLTPPRTEEQEVVQYPLVSVSFFDHSKQEWVNKVGHIEHSGHFVYLEEVIHPNGGEGLKMYSVSPDNYHQMSSSEGQVG